MRIALVAGSSTKLATPAPAKDLYISTLFQLSRRYAEAHADRWYILSAKQGLVTPRTVLAPDNVRLSTLARAERQAWAARVAQALTRYNQPETTWLILAGPTYTEELLPLLHGPLAQPLHGLGLGAQVQWLQRALGPQARAATPATHSFLLQAPAAQQTILAVLQPEQPLCLNEVAARCPAAWSTARVENALRSLAGRGLARQDATTPRATWYAVVQ